MLDSIDPTQNIFDPNIDINTLGQVIDSTWGRVSTPRTSSYSVKFSLNGGYLEVKYGAIVNFGTEREMIAMKANYADESKKVIDSLISDIKKNYKELSGKTLKAKRVFSSDSVEIISNSFQNPKRTAYYRCKCTFEISG